MTAAEKANILRFHCGICAKQLTDSGALFTSCGHFYCAPPSSCTRLRPGNAAGRCEQCGQSCDAGTLAGKGDRYDQRVQDFVFSEPAKNLRTIADILDFRDRHLEILRENMASQATALQKATGAHKLQAREMAQLRDENDTLRAKLERANRKILEYASPSRTRIPSVELVEGPESRIEPVAQVRRREGSQVNNAASFPRDNPVARSKPKQRGNDRYEKWGGRASAVEKRPPRPEVTDPHSSKRRWMDPPVESVVTGSRGRLAGASSRATRVTALSRFARGAAGAAGSGLSGKADALPKRQPGDWQRRVSTVPRPSVTQDRLARRPAKRARPNDSPMGQRW